MFERRRKREPSQKQTGVRLPDDLDAFILRQVEGAVFASTKSGVIVEMLEFSKDATEKLGLAAYDLQKKAAQAELTPGQFLAQTFLNSLQPAAESSKNESPNLSEGA